MKDSFISYNKADRDRAEWIARELTAAGYSVVIQSWDFLPGGNFVLAMHRAASEAERTIALLSPARIILTLPPASTIWRSSMKFRASTRKRSCCSSERYSFSRRP